MADDKTDKGDNGKDKGLSTKEANVHAARFAFMTLYNEGEDFPEDLYLDAEGDELPDGDKLKVYNGYTKVLGTLAAKAGIGAKKEVVYDV